MRSSINNPPYFDGNNYPHWKAYIEFFLRNLMVIIILIGKHI